MTTDETKPSITTLLTDAYAAGQLSSDPTKRMLMMEHPSTGQAFPVRFRELDGGGSTVELAVDVFDAMERARVAPIRHKGTAALAEIVSFLEHVNRHKTKDSAVWADISSFTLTAVYNETPAAVADAQESAWRDHRAVYTCPRSPAWLLWTSLDGKSQSQEAFADHVEANLEHLIGTKGYPEPTEVLQMARDLTVLTKGVFRRSVNPTTGAGILECKSETETGSTVIPRAFMLAIPVFDGGAVYRVEARVRFALVNGAPVFSYTLHRRTEIERDAFNEARAVVADSTGLPVWAGRPG